MHCLILLFLAPYIRSQHHENEGLSYSQTCADELKFLVIGLARLLLTGGLIDLELDLLGDFGDDVLGIRQERWGV